MEAQNLLFLLVLCILRAQVTEDVIASEDTLDLKNQTESSEEMDLNDASNLTADQGNWTVGECIIVKMAGQVKKLYFY